MLTRIPKSEHETRIVESVCRVSLSGSSPDRMVEDTEMIHSWLTRGTLSVLDRWAHRLVPAGRLPNHLHVGARGEEDAYFFLRTIGYIMVARNFRSPRCRGEIELIEWDKDVLCFIEVKTRTTKDVKAAEAAVDRHKRQEVAQVAREYLRRVPCSQWRFDVVSVYYDVGNSHPQIEVFRNASLAA